jgi:hypothetical protein
MSLNRYAAEVHKANEKWWKHPVTGNPLDRNVGELLMLMVSELAEGMEGHRKGLMDDKLPQYEMLDVELVDCAIRIFDLLGFRGVDAEQIYRDKMAFNANREDHKPEHRLAPGGKKY